MTITIRPTRITIALAITLALGIGAVLVYAASMLTYDRPTGVFSVDQEGALATVTTYNAATALEDPAWASCAAPALVPGQAVHCLVRVENAKTSGPIRYGMRVTGAAGPLADALMVQAFRLTSASECNASAANYMFTAAPMSTAPGFGDDQPGDLAGDERQLNVGAGEWVCIRVTYTPGTAQPFGESVSAVVRVISDDTGL